MIDGRKRTVMYFGSTSEMSILPWYKEIKSSLLKDGIAITHLSYSTKSKISEYIRTAKRIEKKYIKALEANPEEARWLEIYYVEDGIEHLGSQFTVYMTLTIKKINKNRKKLCAQISMDFAILDKIDFNKYADITKKYIKWEEEVIFDCGENDLAVNYAINQDTSVFNEIKIISEKHNDKI